VAAGLCAVAVVVAVVPLAALQIPDAMAWSLPARLTAAGPAAQGSVLRAVGLALPAMAVAAPFGALAVRRFRAGRVLVAGLLALAVADVLGDLARSVVLIGADRALHGLGAGAALTAVAAIVAQRAGTGRVLAGWWAGATVCALAAAPALMRHQVTGGGWRAALQPSLWLTGAALALALLYVLVAEGAPSVAVRIAFPPAERSLLTLLAAPVAGLCAIAVTMAARGGHAVLAAALAGVIALAGLTVMATRYSSAGRLAAVCAVTGFTVVPAAAAITSLAPAGQLDMSVCWAVAAGAACGAALVLARPGPGRDGVAAGLFVAAAAFGAAYPAGPALTHASVLMLLVVPLAGGMTAALAAAWRNTSQPGPNQPGPNQPGANPHGANPHGANPHGANPHSANPHGANPHGASRRGVGPGGAMCGVVLLLAGAVAGGLAADAVQILALSGARTAAPVTTVTDWALIAAAVTGAAALVTAFWPARRRPAGPGRTPERG
jgi:hypothetical protein